MSIPYRSFGPVTRPIQFTHRSNASQLKPLSSDVYYAGMCAVSSQTRLTGGPEDAGDLANQYIRSHNDHFEPEARLRAIFVSTPFMLAGLVGLGFALEEGFHYMITSLFWGAVCLQVHGIARYGIHPHSNMDLHSRLCRVFQVF
ncbi:uncharacterized protein AB675_9301 [Cyphellophora attinorum]|uniref:Uncharacterized protein n=1 Tax=Cyphellophora attinorum TaxID=1664694 RepID=A0A0N0NNE5_9EURO|nr:uncharacterized protein AB675_9301 [Phialophora attinorum]KPI41521.1 hypothetical protein AB675_9301 [Phialophora attinorum]